MAFAEAYSIDGLRAAMRQRPACWYAILDACGEPLIPEKVRELGEKRAVSLYRGHAEADYWAIAPYLAMLDERLLDWILARLWGTPWGVFVQSDEGLAGVRKHFRRFLIVRSPEGQEAYFRFYDPRVLRRFLETCSIAESGRFFGTINSFVCAAENGQVLRLGPPVETAKQLGSNVVPSAVVGAGPMQIRREQRDAMAEQPLSLFIGRALKHLRQEFPSIWAAMPDATAETAIRSSTARAVQAGFRREPQVLRFLEVMSLRGPDFGDPDRDALSIEMLHERWIVGNWPKNRAMIVAVKGEPS
jgi:hypothetical protein